MFNPIHGKFLTNPQAPAFVLLRHIRFPTDDQQYKIHCPYNLNHLTLQLLTSSNTYCFNLYSVSGINACQNHESPCYFHAKSLPLRCNHHFYSDYVDISYQCSYKYVSVPKKLSIYKFSSRMVISPPTRRRSFILHALTFPTSFSNSEETIALFLISLGTVLTLWILICCIWLIRCRGYRHQNDTSQLFSYRSYPQIDQNCLSKRNNPTSTDNICFHVNPLESNHISSLRTTRLNR